ncbi:hypothetical protein [Methylocucumis oryzae]|uniref:MBG domain-containing protein n=1 Tax=Methylocucumis oryzae TaxID=1632867 RepID=A0A0F3IJL2_9GAMM|nr:hypothetical protein [Methylocucumis oryzae]KJV06862.1 hypothetical protein VZ94_08555 [Methylocucumis oryzae]
MSSGTDTGSYHVADKGLLAFWYGNRMFGNGAVIDSPNTVTFKYGKNYFNTGATLNADSIVIADEAKVVFKTGNTQTFTDMTISRGILHGSDDLTISRTFNLHAGTLSGIGKLTTTAATTTTLADEDTVYLDKHWDNLGIVNWNGQAALRNSSNYSHFTNLAGGVFNVGDTRGLTDLAINLGQFNNQGTVNLVGGVLKIYSFGTDTGNYLVSNKGFLQFWNGTRNFNSGSVITSDNLVTFNSGINRFNEGSSLAVENILIDSATVNFKTGVTVHIPELTLVNAANLTGTDALSVTKLLAFYSGALGGGGLLTTGKDASVLLSEGISLLNRDWDNYGTVQFINASDSSDAQRTTALDADLPIRYWNNYGTINWLTNQSASSDLGQNVVLTNKTTGIFNIGLSDAESIRELNLGAFNNQGTVNVASGVLRIYSPGKDTGSYVVGRDATLQFYDAKRLFKGATIDSLSPISFVNSDITVRHDTTTNAPSWIIDGSKIRLFDNLTLADVQFSSGIINNFGNLRLTGALNWSGGALSGTGNYQFNNGFAYTGGSLSATGSLAIKDDSGLLVLPTMSSIKRLAAESGGDMRLSGDINASGKGNAIVLTAAGQFDNSAGAALTANNGRWLIFSTNPSDNQLGGLSANFKHYGCSGFICNNGFDVNDQDGNGLLYKVTPVLTVTPDAVTSHYRDPVTFTANYTGFIDGDDVVSAGISGTPAFTSDATSTVEPNYADEGRWDVSYNSGLASRLGYEFKDNTSSTQEWTVLPPQVRPVPVEVIQQGIKDQQNQVLVITKPDTLLMDIADSPKTDDDKNTKPLKQCR